MAGLRRFLLRVYTFLWSTPAERELSREVAAHLRLLEEQYVRGGMTADEARRAARRAFGGVDQVKEHARDVRSFVWLEDLRRDVRIGLRTLRKHRSITVVGVLTLALSIGLCSLFFAQVDALSRPVSGVTRPDALVGLQAPVSYPDFERYESDLGLAAGVTAFMPTPFSVAIENRGGPERTFGHLVSPSYFSALGMRAQVGRLFHAYTTGTEPVLVVSDQFWRARLGADVDAIGRPVRVNGRTATLLGVTPPGFRGIYPIFPADVFVPVTAVPAMAPEIGADIQGDDDPRFTVVMRLRDGVSRSEASAAIDVISRGLELGQPDTRTAGLARTVQLVEAGGIVPLTGELRAAMFGVNGVFLAVILSLACMNLTILLHSRAAQRRREVAVRQALGASRSRVFRQLLTETVLLALAGSAVGMLLVHWLLTITQSMIDRIPSSVPISLTVAVDGRILGFTVVIAIVAGIGAGLAPAWSTVRGNVLQTLRDGALAPLVGYRRFGVRNLFMACQVAASFAMLLLAGVVVDGYRRAAAIDPGFEIEDLWIFAIDPVRDGYSPDEIAALPAALADALTGLAAVGEITVSHQAPFGMTRATPSMVVSAAPDLDSSERTQVTMVPERIGADFFRTLGMPMVGGREFLQRDVLTGAEIDQPDHTVSPAILNATAAQALFGRGVAMGQLVWDGDQPYEVVGVARDQRPAFLTPTPAPTLFLPLRRRDMNQASTQGIAVILRGTGTGDTMQVVRGQVASSYPDLTLFNARAMTDQVDQFSFMLWLTSALNGAVGLFGLALACVGLGGVTAHAVARQRKEIGIRMALGARADQVLRQALREGAVLLGVGAVVGGTCALALVRLMATSSAQYALIFGSSTDGPAFPLGLSVTLIGVVMLACYWPAHRSMQLPPIEALREE